MSDSQQKFHLPAKSVSEYVQIINSFHVLHLPHGVPLIEKAANDRRFSLSKYNFLILKKFQNVIKPTKTQQSN